MVTDTKFRDPSSRFISTFSPRGNSSRSPLFRSEPFPRQLFSGALGNDERDIVLLFGGAELADFVDDRVEEIFRVAMAMAADCFHQALFAEFFVAFIECFGDAVGVEHQRVGEAELVFAERAVPFFEQSEHCAGGTQPDACIVGAQKESRKMAAI